MTSRKTTPIHFSQTSIDHCTLDLLIFLCCASQAPPITPALLPSVAVTISTP
jgi:hypothetical protein